MFSIQSYKKSYNGRTILSIPNLNLTTGIYWIKGVNGSGKSTLFQSIAQYIPHQGYFTLDAIRGDLSSRIFLKKLSYSEAEPQFPPFLTQKELLLFTAQCRGIDFKLMQELAELFSTTDYWNNPVHTYSSGMLKKTGLIMALAGRQSLVILDEPFTTIDDTSRDLLKKHIRTSQQKDGTMFLISSHEDAQAYALPYTASYEIKNQQLILCK